MCCTYNVHETILYDGKKMECGIGTYGEKINLYTKAHQHYTYNNPIWRHHKSGNCNESYVPKRPATIIRATAYARTPPCTDTKITITQKKRRRREKTMVKENGMAKGKGPKNERKKKEIVKMS